MLRKLAKWELCDQHDDLIETIVKNCESIETLFHLYWAGLQQPQSHWMRPWNSRVTDENLMLIGPEVAETLHLCAIFPSPGSHGNVNI